MKDTHVYSHYKEAVIGAAIDLAKEHPEVVFLDRKHCIPERVP